MLAAFGLGLALCAPPGVVFAETVRRGLGRGFRAALGVQMGSLVGDGTWAALALGGAALLAQQCFRQRRNIALRHHEPGITNPVTLRPPAPQTRAPHPHTAR